MTQKIRDLTPRTYGNFNALGFYTLYTKEVKRFTAIINQTIGGPIITGLLFLAVFKLSIGRYNAMVGDITFTQFLVPGLIAMQVLQNAFSNNSSSLVSGKMSGSIVDVLMPPLNNWEILLAYVLSSITRGLMVATIIGIAMIPFTDIYMHSIVWTVSFCVIASVFMALLGIISGILCERWEHIASFTTYIITPLSFLSGTFYSIHRLPEILQELVKFNPMFYMIDGIRFGFTGYSDTNPWMGIGILLVSNIILYIITKRLLDSGHNLRP